MKKEGFDVPPKMKQQVSDDASMVYQSPAQSPKLYFSPKRHDPFTFLARMKMKHHQLRIFRWHLLDDWWVNAAIAMEPSISNDVVQTITTIPNHHKQVLPFPVMGGKHGIVFTTLIIHESPLIMINHHVNHHVSYPSLKAVATVP